LPVDFAATVGYKFVRAARLGAALCHAGALPDVGELSGGFRKLYNRHGGAIFNQQLRVSNNNDELSMDEGGMDGCLL
jgi:hypothetical protein